MGEATIGGNDGKALLAPGLDKARSRPADLHTSRFRRLAALFSVWAVWAGVDVDVDV